MSERLYGRVNWPSPVGALARPLADNFDELKRVIEALGAAVHVVVLESDVTNSNGTPDTLADVTGLSFAVDAGLTYWFEASIPYTAAATTTGSRWTLNGPASPTLLNYWSRYPLTATTETVNYATAYSIPAASNASSLTAGNVARIGGHITPSARGTVTVRFASEVASSAIVAKAGAVLLWRRVMQ